MTGKEDVKITEYFINKAFPTEEQEDSVINALEENRFGLKFKDMLKECNMSKAALEKTLNMLQHRNIIYFDTEKKYYRSLTPYSYNGEHYEAIKKEKRLELNIMTDYVEERGCLSKYVLNALDDSTAHECGKCKNCIKGDVLEELKMPSEEEINAIQHEFDTDYIEIMPRKKWPDQQNEFDKNTVIEKPNEIGIAISKYGDPGYGEMVEYDKYHGISFRNELLERSVELLKEKIEGENAFSAICNVPSFRNKKVADFAMRLAERLGIAYIDILEKKEGCLTQQKDMENSAHQFKNASESFAVRRNENAPARVILVDDVVDSKWTLTVCGRLLTKAGAEKVLPFCLADSSEIGDD